MTAPWLIGALIDDLLAETRTRLARSEQQTSAELRRLDFATVSLSPPMMENLLQLKAFLYNRMYRHPRVVAAMSVAKEVVAGLFTAFAGDPALMPPDWRDACGGPGETRTAQVARDYIAGMTDRFARVEYRRIFQTHIEL